jgi:hypothetical protein
MAVGDVVQQVTTSSGRDKNGEWLVGQLTCRRPAARAARM